MTLDASAHILWDLKYKEHHAKADFDSSASSNFKSRLSSHIIKTAIAVSVSESDNLIITGPQLARAIGYVEAIRDKVDIVFRSVGESSLAVSQDKVLSLIEKQGVVSRQEILHTLYKHMTDDELSKILIVLVNGGYIEEVTQGNKTLYQQIRKVTP
jgi:hypothetical protein